VTPNGSACAWTAGNGPAWITITAGGSGIGSGTVNYTVAANTGTTSRTGTLTIAGETFTATQAGNTCNYSIGGSTASFGSAGGPGSVSVTAGSGCTWTASSSLSWITTTSSGTGSGTASYSVAANTATSSRSGTLTIASQTFTISQSAPTLDNPPTGVSLTSPSDGATISGTETFTGTASDDHGVSRVEFWCDGSVLLGTATTAPYTITWNTAAAADGSHTFTCKAYDAAGHSTTSAANTATVSNVVQSGGAWAKGFVGSGYEYGKAVAVDATGNIIVAGYSDGSVDLGGGLLIGAGGWDLLLAKYSPTGAHLWSKRFGGTGTEAVTCIALDAAGNIFVGGSFYGTGNFGGANFTSAGDADAFLAKYSPQGNHLWSLAFGDTQTDIIKSIAVDSQGSIVATGYYWGTVPLISSQATTFVTTTFLLKFSTTGTKTWVKSFTTSGNVGTGVAVDRNDNILMAGYFQGGINLGAGTLLSSQNGGYVGKFSADGVCLWSRNAGVSAFPYYARPGSIAVDSNGDAVVGGYFATATDLGGGSIQGTSAGWDMFLVKYSGSDGAYRWARPINGTYNGEIRSMTTDAQNNLLVVGYFRGTYNFGNQSLTSPAYGVDNGFLAKYTSAGAPVWAEGLISPASQSLGGVAVDSSNRPIVTGGFTGTTGCASQTLTSTGGSTDIILGRLDP
jgi:hypothetical protein